MCVGWCHGTSGGVCFCSVFSVFFIVQYSLCHVELPIFLFFFSSFPVFLLVLFLFFVLFCFCHVVLSWLSLPFLILSANMKYHFLSFSFLSKICQQHFSPPILSLNFVNKFSSIFSFCHKILSINSPPFFHFVTKFCQ